MSQVRVGIVGTSSVVPQVEFGMGVAVVRAAGFDVTVHSVCEREHFLFSGSDQERVDAFIAYAYSDELDVILAARGGYGATRMLPLLEEAARKRGKPSRKLLVGYSDITALHHFVHAKWNWHTLHAPMPAASNFPTLPPAQSRAMFELMRGLVPSTGFLDTALRMTSGMFPGTIRGKLVGGNLALWAALAGTGHQPSARDCIVFFEDIDEQIYRIDRMVTQLLQAGMLAGARAIVLGDFTNCLDEVPNVLAGRAAPGDVGTLKKPLREKHDTAAALTEIFSRAGVPVFTGLPVGHGPNFWPLPLHAEYEITSDRMLQLMEWDWIKA